MPSAATDPCRLPGVLAEVEEVAGREAALRLSMSSGGNSIYVPRPSRVCPDHQLARAMGVDAAQKVAERFQGEIIDIPMARRALVRGLAERGLSTADIAGQLKLSRKTVRRYRR